MKINLNNAFVFKKIWFNFFIIKLLYVFFTLFIYSKIVQLGDMQSYLNGYNSDSSIMFISSTAFVGTISHILYICFGEVITSIIFMSISFYGIYYSVNKMNLTNKDLILLLIILSFPSFSIWTSIAGKESISVLFMGILFGYLVDFINKMRFFNLIEFVALYFGLLMKPQYIVPIIIFIVFVYIKRKLGIRKYGDIILIMFFIGIGISIVIIFGDKINSVFYHIPAYFSLEGNSTREESFWQEDYDFLFKIPEGVFLGFTGPTLMETLERIQILPVYMESITLCIIILYIMLKSSNVKINTLNLSIFIFIVIGILILSYPFSVMNYSTAIRYREGYYAFLFEMIFYVFLAKRNKFIKKDYYEENSNCSK
jgi:hypothetical protein